MEPSRTPYDLQWQMFGIPIRVHPMFWLVSVIMGANTFQSGIQYLLIWIACMFVSILIHELGHVWMGQAFGSHGHIVLYGFGGLAIGSNHLTRRWQRIAVSFAGPLAGFLFLGILFLGLWAYDAEVFPLYLNMALDDLGLPREFGWAIVPVARDRLPSPLLWNAIGQLIFINLLWGLVNLLPVWPLDGGQIARDVCEGASPERGLTQSLGLSLLTAGILAVHCFLGTMGRQLLPLPFGSLYAALLFGILAFQSYQLLQQASARRRWTEDHWDQRD